ncbi:MAG: hypothetical protein IV100_05655 [Myxococcales bacterium]|nr:hypothetical protein [Myxococcales bacterium]
MKTNFWRRAPTGQVASSIVAFGFGALVGCTEAGDKSLFPLADTGSADGVDGSDGSDGVDGCTVEPIPEALASLFQQKCGAGCHTGGSASGGLALDADKAAANLVGIKSVGGGSKLRVVAGDSSASYLVQKVDGTPGVVPQMPLGAALSATEVALISDWVDSLTPCTSTDGTTATDAVDGTDATTATDAVDGTDATTATDAVDGTDATTATDAVDGTDATTATDAVDGTPGACEVPEDIATLINSKCAGCHTGGSKLGNFDFDPSRAVENAVEVKGTTGDTLIEPGKPDDSYLMDKLKGSAGISGSKMPLGAPLTDGEIQAFADWITALDGCEP